VRSGRESNGQDNDSAFGVLPPVQTAQPTCPSPGSGPNSHANRVKGHFRHSCHTYYCYPCKSSLLMRVWHLCRMYSSPWYWVSHYAAPAQCACARCARTPIHPWGLRGEFLVCTQMGLTFLCWVGGWCLVK